MAYDPHSSYEPPRRAYYGQEQHSAPPRQQDYYGGVHDQYGGGHDQYGGYDQQYGDERGYNGRNEQHGYEDDNRGPPGQRYDSGYGGDFSKSSQQRGPHPSRGQNQPYQRQPPPRGPGPRGAYDNPRQRPRPPPERQYQPQPQPHGRSHPPDARDDWGAEERPGRRPAPPGPPPPVHAHPPRGASRPRDPRVGMDEWKAQERAKMHGPKSPNVLPQDNAFPTFPNSRPTSGPEHNRRSEDHTRSSTSSSRPAVPRHGHSYEDPNASGRSRQQHDPPYESQHGRPPPQNSYDRGRPYQEPPRNAPPQQYNEPEASQPRFSASDYAQDYAAEVHNPYETSLHDRRPEPPRPKTANSTRPVPRPIDTSFAQDLPRPGYMNHNPMSPAFIPPRPSTSHGSRPPAPQSAYATKPYVLQPNADRHSLDDVLDDYGASDPVSTAPQPLRRAMTRDEEIESEMPDFDSAAPNQSKGLHNRPAPAAQPASVSTAPYSTARPYAKPSEHTQSDPQMSRGAQAPTNGYADFDFGVPQQPQQNPHVDMPEPPRAPYANEPPVRRSMDDARDMPYRSGPPRGPLPNRPGQRFPGAGGPPRGPLPPHMRPDMDRSQSAGPMQPTPMSYGQIRSDSAPPPRPGSEGTSFTPRTGSLPGNSSGGPVNGRANSGDSLPHHPVPVRPGLMDHGSAQPSRPPPVRHYDQTPASRPPPPQGPPSEEPAKPVAQAGLGQRRAAVDANPNSPRQALNLVKKLAEASVVLASEGGRADAKATAKNRERYCSEAYKRLKKLVAGGYPDAMFYMADCFGSGELGLEIDPKEAFTLYQAAAKGGHGAAAFRTAVCCEIGPEDGGGTRKDYPKAVQWYRRAAALGDVAGMYKIGAILLKGLLGQEKHMGEAVNWLKRSAERADAENPHALHELGLLYDSTNTSPEVRNKIIADDQYARELFEKAARFGFKASQFRMGQAYEYGSLGLPIDNRASIAWYSKAAAQGEHQAELALSGWYLTGAEGILQQSDTEAYLWARKAAASEPPLAKAMFAMGYFSEQGIGCPPNLDEARRWYGRAASYKFPKALERLEELKNAKAGKGRPPPGGGRLTRKDQKRDEAECVVM